MARVQVYMGTHQSTRRSEIDARLIANLENTRLIVPTQRTVQQRTRRILSEHALPGLLGNPIVTFEKFAEALLDDSTAIRLRVPALTQHVLLQQAIEKQRGSESFAFLGEAAQSAGFLQHVQRIISQLKQSAIDPEQFHARVVQRKRGTPFDAVVAEVYTAYQESLVESGACDLQGMYWLADEACQKEQPRSLESIDTLLIDGFDDFTPSEFRLIQSVAPHVKELAFGLNYSNRPNASDAYSLPVKTNKAIQAAFEVEDIDCEKVSSELKTSCQAISHFLFSRDPKSIRPKISSPSPNLALQHCATVTEELERLARRVKRDLVEERAALSDILIVFKNPDTYRDTMKSVFEEVGVPWRSSQSATLSMSDYADFLANCYRATADWNRDRVLHVLTSPYFRSLGHGDGTHVAEYRRIALLAGFPEEGADWSKGLDRFIDRLDTDSGRQMRNWLDRMPTLREAAHALLGDVQRLASVSESFAESTSLAEHLERFVSLSRMFTVDELAERVDSTVAEENVSAWYAIQGLSLNLESMTSAGGASLSRAEFVATIREWFSMIPVPQVDAREGVLCLSLEEARHLEYPIVYMCGVNEGIVPSAPPRSAIYSHDDRLDLLEAGIELKSASGHIDMERLQFLHLFSVATQRLTITWHEHNTQGQPMYRSPYVSEIERLVESGFASLMDSPTLDTWYASRGDVLSAAMLGACSAPPELNDIMARIHERSVAEASRWTSETFNEYDGMISDDALKTELSEFFDERHLFSANQVETHINCPFRYLMSSMLNLPVIVAPSSVLDPRTVGTILHDSLEALFKAHSGTSISSVSLVELIAEVEQIASDVFDHVARDYVRSYPGIARSEKARVTDTLRRHVKIEHERDEGVWKPTYFETVFGDRGGNNKNALSTEQAFELPLGEHRYRFSGRIDRIDLDDDGNARVVDYKSSLGSGMGKDMREGRNIQLALYGFAVESLFSESISKCTEARYEHVGRDSIAQLSEKYREEIEAAAKSSIESAIQRMQQGIFHPTAEDESCSYCPSNKVCRYEEARVSGKAPE